MLCAMRKEGWSFERAWPNAIQRIRVQPYMTTKEAEDLLEWKRLLDWARPCYAAAYERRPAPSLNGDGMVPDQKRDLSAADAAPVLHH